MVNGIDCCNNQTSSYSFATAMVCWMGLKCYIQQNITSHGNFIDSLVDGHENRSHVTHRDHYIG